MIQRLGAGDAAVADELFALVYDELHAVAQRLFARQPANHTLQPTALVHEAWLKLAGNDIGWESRGHFFSVAARAMRQVLTDKARAQRAERRGKGRQKVTLDEELVAAPAGCDIVDLDDALQRLAAANQRHARVVELKLFAGLSLAEIATVLAVTPRTIQLDWRSASAFLRHVLDSPQTP
ncbi:MAG TPA: ECF-type sigma factor [Planctomycetota bacterium]|nr:ECF-type sigma factor [Planctomycetota bacterium]